MRRAASELSYRQKAALLLMLLGPSRAAMVMQHLPEEYIEALSLEMARLGKVHPDQKMQVITDFHELAMAQDIDARELEQAKLIIAEKSLRKGLAKYGRI